MIFGRAVRLKLQGQEKRKGIADVLEKGDILEHAGIRRIKGAKRKEGGRESQ